MSRFIRKVFIKERGSKVFRKIPPSPFLLDEMNLISAGSFSLDSTFKPKYIDMVLPHAEYIYVYSVTVEIGGVYLHSPLEFIINHST